MHPLQGVLSGFSDYLRQVGYSLSSVYMLPHCVGEFLAFSGVREVSAVTTGDVCAFYEWLQGRPLQRRPGALSGAMINHYGYSLRTFFNWLEAAGYLRFNPVSGLRLQRQDVGQRHPLSPDQTQALFARAPGLREQAVLHLFYSCGLRRSEGEWLCVRDVDTVGGLLYVRSGKGARRRVLPLAAQTVSCFAAYLAAERAEPATGKDSFMENRCGERMRGDSYNDVVHTIGLRAGLAEPVTLHRLRHSIATHLLGRGMDMEQVRMFLGHASLDTTQIYARAGTDKILGL